jgi:hypothetical protein
MAWAAYLAPLNGVAEAAAIIQLYDGKNVGKIGAWKAKPAEEQVYSYLVREKGADARARGVNYNGKKYVVNQVDPGLSDAGQPLDDGGFVFAQLGKEGVVLQKSKTVVIAAHFTEGQVGNSVSGQVSKIVSQLKGLGY